MRKWLLGIALVWASMGQAYAEPSPSISGLMNTPASLFTVGMYRLDLRVKQLANNFAIQRDDATHYFSATYNWNENRIYIDAYMIGTPFDTRDLFEQHCSELFWEVRASGLVSPDTGDISYDRLRSAYAELFGHIGYTNNTLSERLNEIDQIILIKLSSSTDGLGRGTCTGPLLGTGFSVSYSQ